MLNKNQKNIILDELLDKLELPESAYDKAKSRYDDLGTWFSRQDSTIKDLNPHIFPQGSFRLGTAIRPLNGNEEYDLDLSCKLRERVTKLSHSQKQVKDLIKVELESYKDARGIKESVKEKPRCWRLEYQDDLKFHMDIVPSIPADENRRVKIFDSLEKGGVQNVLSSEISSLTSNITDNRHGSYSRICDDWQVSNPEGYAKWFESRLDTGIRVDVLEKARVDKIPLFKKRAPLQKAVQLLKRHRDQMFQGNDESKPISIIITTLAAKAYSGESDLESALSNVLVNMGKFISSSSPRIANPVNPEEDFSDKWPTIEGQKLKLEEWFWRWLDQAQRDFNYLFSSSNAGDIATHTGRKFVVQLDENDLSKSLNLPVVSSVQNVQVIDKPAPPWSDKKG